MLDRVSNAPATDSQGIGNHHEFDDAIDYSQLLVEVSPVGIITYRSDGSAMLANHAAAEIVGASVAQLRRQNFRRLESWRKSGLLELAERALDTWEIIEKDVHHLSTFGKEVWFSVRMVPFMFRGEPHLMALLSDITERKRTEAMLRDSEEQFRAIFDGATDGMLLADPATRRFRTGNPAICRMLGYSSRELSSVAVTDIHFDDDLRLETARFDAVARGERDFVSNVRIRRKDGTFFYADIKASRLHLKDGEVLLGMFRDVTERVNAQKALEESESKFRSLVEQGVLGVYLVQDRRIIYANPRGASLVGETSPDALVGTDPLARVVEADRSKVGRAFRRLSRAPSEGLALEISVVHANGTTIPAALSGACAIHRGRPAVVAMLHDISEREQAAATSAATSRSSRTRS